MAHVDYDFFDAAARGAYTREAKRTREDWIRRACGSTPPMEPLASFHKPQFLYQFSLKSGKTRLSYGVDAADALETLRLRMTGQEMEEIETSSGRRIGQEKIHAMKHSLG